MVNYKAISVAFVVLTIIFAGTTGYLVAYPSTTTQTTVSTQTSTTTVPVTTTLHATAPSFTVNIAYKSGIGFYLTNATGFTLYFRSTDTPYSGKTTVTTDTAEKNWPVFYASSLSLPPGLNASAFSIITPYNSTQIVTYNGYPLFYWIQDTQPGETSGQGIGKFYVATLPTPTVPATTSTTTTTT